GGAPALFNFPHSIIMAADGTMYVADKNNNAVRKISPDGQMVSTLVGKQPVPDDDTVAQNPDTYCPLGTIGFADAYTASPQVIRFTSTGNIVLGDAFLSPRLIDLSAQTVQLIGSFGNARSFDPNWTWLDVDTAGT